MVFFILSSADPVYMPHNAVFHLGLHCLSNYPFEMSDLNVQNAKLSTANTMYAVHVPSF